MKNWKDYSFIVRSEHRKKVFEALDEPKTPTQLASDLGMNIGHVSNMIISLLERNLVVCLNPDEKRHRLYERSEKGKDLFTSMFKSKDTQ